MPWLPLLYTIGVLFAELFMNVVFADWLIEGLELLTKTSPLIPNWHWVDIGQPVMLVNTSWLRLLVQFSSTGMQICEDLQYLKPATTQPKQVLLNCCHILYDAELLEGIPFVPALILLVVVFPLVEDDVLFVLVALLEVAVEFVFVDVFVVLLTVKMISLECEPE